MPTDMERRFQQFRSRVQHNGSYGTTLRQRHNGTAERQWRNGNGSMATEGWKPAIIQIVPLAQQSTQ